MCKHLLVFLAFPLAHLFASPPADGLADLEARADEVVHLHLNSATLQAAARAFPQDASQDASFFQALSGVSDLQVISLSFHGEGMPAQEDIDAVRSVAVPAGWTRFLSTKSSDPQEMVNGYAGPSGLAIIVAEPDEITAVHIDGILSSGAIPLLSHRFGLPAIGSGDSQPGFAARGDHAPAANVHAEKLDFKRMVHEIEAQEGIHHVRIPGMGLISPIARIASGGQAKALDVAVFENAPAGFVDAVDRTIPEGWSRMVEVHEGKEATDIYIGAVDQDMPLLIATWDGDGVLVTVKANLKDLCKSPLAWGNTDHDTEQ
jgi:uncharacterized protein YbdZ (MbtH family)